MILGSKQSDTQLMMLVPSIRNYMNEWQILSVMLKANSIMTTEDALDKLLIAYKDYEGIIYPVSDRKIICLVRLGVINNYATIKSDLQQKLPEHSCRILAKKMSSTGLQQVQIDLLEKDTSNRMTLFDERERRKKNILMVADDDMFARKVMRQILENFGETVEAENGDDVITKYLEHNPDIVILDIHMPGMNGLLVIDKIMEMDPDACIIISSADSVKDNVMISMEKGAIGFLSKPPTKGKIANYINKCITIK